MKSPSPPLPHLLQMEVVSMPMIMGMGIAMDIMDGGELISRSLAIMDVSVLGG